MPVYKNGNKNTEPQRVTVDLLNDWLSNVYVPAIKKLPLNINTGNGVSGTADRIDSFYNICRSIARYVLQTSIKVDQLDDLIAQLTSYEYYVNGDLVTLDQREILAALVLLCKKLNLTWNLTTTKATDFEIEPFKESTFGKILIRYGLVGDDILNYTPKHTGDVGVDPGDVDAFENSTDVQADNTSNETDTQEVATEEPVTEPVTEPEGAQEPQVEPEQVTDTATDSTDSAAAPEEATEEEPIATPAKPRKRKKKKENPKDHYSGNITDTVKSNQDPYLKDKDGKYLHYKVETIDQKGNAKTELRKIHVPTGNDKYDKMFDCVETGKPVRGKNIGRKAADQSFYPKMSPYVTNIISTPLSPLPMTGESGMIYIIKGHGNATSNKCPKAYIMPLNKQLKDTRTGELEPVKNLNSKKRVNDKGELKVHIAGSSTVQNQTIFFNTVEEAKQVLNKILQADDADSAAGVEDSYLRVAKGVNKADLVVCGIMLYTLDPHWRNNLKHFEKGFYEVDTEFGRAWICAKNLFEELTRSGKVIIEEKEICDEKSDDKCGQKSTQNTWYEFYEKNFEA